MTRNLNKFLDAIESLCVAFETKELSVLDLLEHMKKNVDAIPCIESYIRDCQNTLDDFSKMISTCQDIMRDSTYHDRNLKMFVKLRMVEGAYLTNISFMNSMFGNNFNGVSSIVFIHKESLVITFHSQGVRFQSDESLLLRSKDRIPIEDCKREFFKRIDSRASIQCVSENLTVSEKGPTWEFRDDIMKKITSIYGPLSLTNHITAFDPIVCRKQAIEFLETETDSKTHTKSKYVTGIMNKAHENLEKAVMNLPKPLSDVKKSPKKTEIKTFTISIAPSGRAKCRGCKKLIERFSMRVSKLITNGGHDGDDTSHHYHYDHGLLAAIATHCTGGPRFVIDKSLDTEQANKASIDVNNTLGAWEQKCHKNKK